MKKQTKLVLIIVAAVAVIIIAGSLFYPPIADRLTRGTINKAEKYRKQTMSEKDIQLRSEFVKDTVQLRKLIRGLASFQQFNEKICRQIDSSLLYFQNHPIMTDVAYNQPLFALKDFSLYLANMSTSIETTKRMLETFYYNDEPTDQSVDVEKNLREFGAFIRQVVERDTVLEMAAMDIDKYIEKANARKRNIEDTKPLKQFRDQLVVNNLMTAAMLGQHSSLDRLKKYARTLDTDEQIVSAVNKLSSTFLEGTLSGYGMQSMMKMLEAQSIYVR